MSFVDGSGAQMVMLAWIKPDGLLKGVNLLCQDEWGIKDCYGTDEMPMERWQELVGNMDEQGFISFKVPLDYCRALIVEARQQNKRGRHKLPVAYAVWRPLIESGMPAAKKTLSPPTMLEPLHFDEHTSELAARGDELYKLPEFDPWLFEPFASLHPYVNSYLNLDARHAHARASQTQRNEPSCRRLNGANRRCWWIPCWKK